MNITHQIALRAEVAPDWMEYRPGIEVIPTAHPPSLKKPKKVEPDTPDVGWHEEDSKKKKKKARKDLKIVMDRIQRQPGKPVLVRHAVQNTQSIHAPLIW